MSPELSWQDVSYLLHHGSGAAFASAHVTWIGGDGAPWLAFCAGPYDTNLPSTAFESAETAKAAVADHIAAALAAAGVSR